MHILVVDDQINTLLPGLRKKYESQGIKFDGLENFDYQEVSNTLRQNLDITVVVLDIFEDENRPGFDLFHKISQNQNQEFENFVHNQQQNTSKPAFIKIVFFTQKTSSGSEHAEVASQKSPFVAGFLEKNLVLEASSEALQVLRRAHEDAMLLRNYPVLADPIRSDCDLVHSMNSHVMTKLWRKILLAGQSRETVLIVGESGTGKELVAQAIYQVMKNSELPPEGTLCAYNIASAPFEGNIGYTELFGALKGSYTGNTDNRIGLFEQASGQKSPIFLDEIGDAPTPIQIMLLRVLQSKEIMPLGAFHGPGVVKLNYLRLITATNVDFQEKIKEGTFRLDLYYRLRTIQIKVPPLRERKDDIPVLVYHFLKKCNEDYGRNGTYKEIIIDSSSANKLFERLTAYHWPGNVRELEMVIRSSYAQTLGTVFQLAEDVEELLDGINELAPTIVPPDALLKQLETEPQPLKKIKKTYGEETARAVYECLVKNLGRHPNDEQAQRYFGPEATNLNLRQWASKWGISVR